MKIDVRGMLNRVKVWYATIPASLFVTLIILGLAFAGLVALAENGSETASTPAHAHPRGNTHAPSSAHATPRTARPCGPVVVRRGETISQIAERVGRGPRYLMRRNHIKRAWLIQPGQVLCTRGKVEPPEWPFHGEIRLTPPVPGPEPRPLSAPVPKPSYSGVPLLEQPPNGQLRVPVYPYVITQGWKGQYPNHNGLDFAGPYGSAVRTVAGGKVIGVWWWHYSYGYHVLIQHAGGRTQYAHLANIYVHVGQRVTRDQVIGIRDTTGHSTGDHLHFEMWKNGVTVNPAPYFWKYGSGGWAPRYEKKWTGHD